MPQAFILGGTKGLGLALAWESHVRGITPVITGRAVFGDAAKKFPHGSESFYIDLSDKESLRHSLASVGYYASGAPYFFWVAGLGQEKPFVETTSKERGLLMNTHILGPWEVLQTYLKERGSNPSHIVVIASTSSWRLRNRETVYCTVKSGKAAFARNLANEISLPSMVTLINPGGIRTPNFWGEKRDISGYMTPETVARIIWDEATSQKNKFKEVNIMRTNDGQPVVSYGPRTPEIAE